MIRRRVTMGRMVVRDRSPHRAGGVRVARLLHPAEKHRRSGEALERQRGQDKPCEKETESRHRSRYGNAARQFATS